MIIDLTKIKYYCLTTGKNQKRVAHIKKIFQNYDLTFIYPLMGDGLDKQRSGCIGTGRMVEAGLRNQIYGKPFQPFIMVEDDVSFFENISNTIEIPDNSDYVYVGVSAAGVSNNFVWRGGNHLYANNHDTHVIRVFNMLSTHAIMISSPLGANIYSRCMLEGFLKPRDWDCYLANIQPYYNVYALKKPIFYQDEDYGGLEFPTKIIFSDNNIIYKYQDRKNPVPNAQGRVGGLPTKIKSLPQNYKPTLINSLLLSSHPNLNFNISQNNISLQ